MSNKTKIIKVLRWVGASFFLLTALGALTSKVIPVFIISLITAFMTSPLSGKHFYERFTKLVISKEKKIAILLGLIIAWFISFGSIPTPNAEADNETANIQIDQTPAPLAINTPEPTPEPTPTPEPSPTPTPTPAPTPTPKPTPTPTPTPKPTPTPQTVVATPQTHICSY